MTGKKLKKAIGSEVRRIRKDAGWSQAKLAKKIGLSQSGISQVERGAKSLTAVSWFEFCRVTKTQPYRLLFIKGSPARRLAGAASR